MRSVHGLLTSEVRVGATYMTKVGARTCPVTVLRRLQDGRRLDGWECRNEFTGALLIVKCSRRFREELRRAEIRSIRKKEPEGEPPADDPEAISEALLRAMAGRGKA